MGTWRDSDRTWASSDGVRDEPGDRPSAPTGDRYTDAETLGEGGLGRVVATHDALLDRTVARKFLLRALPSHRERFVREARITARLQHPSIVPVYEMGTTPAGAPWYTMKRVDGESLAAALGRAGGLEQRLALVDAVLRACQAVAYAHEQGVIHRDLKPDNLLLGRFGETWVVDWGLARALDDPEIEPTEDDDPSTAGGLTRVGAVVGTPGWMSPEQAAGLVAGRASDVWSLGALLYATLTGQRPFADQDVEVVLTRTRTERVPPVAGRAPDAPRDLAAVAEKALAFDPADRYPDAKALAEDLQAWTSGRRVRAFAYSPWQIVRQEAWRHRWRLLAAGVALLAVLGGLAEADRRERAGTQRALGAERREREVTGRALAESLVSSGVVALREGDVLLAGAQGAIALRYADLPEARGLVARALGAGAPRPLEFLDAGFPCRWIQVTPDARTVLCGGESVVAFRDGTRAWDLRGRTLDGQLSPDGAALVVSIEAPRPTVQVVSAEDGRVVWQRDAGDEVIAVAWAAGLPAWSEGGTLHTPEREATVCTSRITDLATDARLHAICVSGAWTLYNPATLAPLHGPLPSEGVAFTVLPAHDGTWLSVARTVAKLGPDRKPIGRALDTAGYPVAMAGSADGRWLAVSTDRGVVRWFDLSKDTAAAVVPASSPRAGVAFGGDDLWTSGTAGPVRWSAPSPNPLEAVRDVATVLPLGGRRVVVSTANGQVDAIDLSSGERVGLIESGQPSRLYPVAGQVLCTRVGDGRLDTSWIGPEGPPEPAGPVPLSWEFAGATSEGTLLWRDRKGPSTLATDRSFRESGRRPGHDVGIVGDGPITLSGGTLAVLSSTTLAPLREVPLVSVDGAPIPADPDLWVGSGPDGRWWFRAGRAEGLVALDPSDGTVRRASQETAGNYSLLQGGRLALGGWDGTVRIVDGGRTVAVLPGRGARASQVVELGGGVLVVTDWDGNATTWDLSALEQTPEELWQRVLPQTGFDWVDGRVVRR